jgi:hypothetical protein
LNCSEKYILALTLLGETCTLIEYCGVLLDSTGFDQAKAIIGRKRDSEPEKFCSLNQVINEDCLDF